MPEPLVRNYIFLDSETERKQLIEDISTARKAVLEMIDLVPKAQWYEPRYHGWSLGAMLAHLHLSDNLVLLSMKLALVNIPLPIPSAAWDQVNNFTTRVFRQRVIETTIGGIRKNEPRIADFILRLPVKQLSKNVYDPPLNKYLTIEQAVQEFFVYHWRDHLRTMLAVEGLSENSDKVM